MPHPDTLIAGEPRFADQPLADILRQDGPAAAWHHALQQLGPARAAAAATNGFAVGLTGVNGSTFLAVDRFAIHSLCYRLVDGRLHFAERADQLGDGDLDPQAIFDYLYFHCIPSPRTIFRNVFRLPPGHYALYENGQLTVAPYWVPEFTEPRGPVSFDALKAEFRTLLREAVATQLDGSTAACFLSGGTDSSTVAGMVREATGKPAATYSIGFEAEGYDEMAFARIAAKHFGTEHHEYYVTPADLVRSIADVAGSYDQPFGNSSALPAYYCALSARQDGVTRMLAGDGGDELFGGNSRYAKQRVFGWYAHVPASLRRSLVQPLFELPATSRVPLLKKGSSYVEQAKVPMPDRLQMYNLLLRLGTADVLEPRFLARVDLGSPAAQQREVWALARAGDELNRTLAYDWRYTLAESDLPKVNGSARLAGMQVRYPMLDDRLLDFSLGLPAAYKLKGLKLRWFFKEALRGFLPDEIITKKKQGFGLPFGVWLTRHAPLMALAQDSLASLSGRGIVRPAFIRQLVDQRLQEHPGYYGEMIWILMMLEQWLQRHAPGYRLTD
ncbi:asparagine synthetase B family protein [Aquabacterium sp.]|uniref:asparagine synthetase B family protein n=1 Tax=Aquabacterium sp. TaxID=1872578 RepID=UPI002B89C72B|nr:asparagine synthase C-terminal domain-containing protein [Aquabacterium sp.]HSW08971.1 asparagine synthase C-terminal domain-containing protein [Aquabacterium sp.]